MPRVCELRELVGNADDQNAYFQDFDCSILNEPSKTDVWLARERSFQKLDPNAWGFLKDEIKKKKYLFKNSRRDYEQLISLLNQAFAYGYLIDEGCMHIKFIPESKQNGLKTPDLEAVKGDQKVLCEVKTIWVSEEEVDRRKSGEGGTIKAFLESNFLDGKLNSVLHTAKGQLLSYGKVENPIVFLVLNFDDFLAEYKRNYYQQIDQYIGVNSISDINIVFYNQKTAFHSDISMRHAVVINE